MPTPKNAPYKERQRYYKRRRKLCLVYPAKHEGWVLFSGGQLMVWDGGTLSHPGLRDPKPNMMQSRFRLLDLKAFWEQ